MIDEMKAYYGDKAFIAGQIVALEDLKKDMEKTFRFPYSFPLLYMFNRINKRIAVLRGEETCETMLDILRKPIDPRNII